MLDSRSVADSIAFHLKRYQMSGVTGLRMTVANDNVWPHCHYLFRYWTRSGHRPASRIEPQLLLLANDFQNMSSVDPRRRDEDYRLQPIATWLRFNGTCQGRNAWDSQGYQWRLDNRANLRSCSHSRSLRHSLQHSAQFAGRLQLSLLVDDAWRPQIHRLLRLRRPYIGRWHADTT
jgi:hypothetical protein